MSIVSIKATPWYFEHQISGIVPIGNYFWSYSIFHQDIKSIGNGESTMFAKAIAIDLNEDMIIRIGHVWKKKSGKGK